MATKRLSMRQLREILRQKLLLCRTHREVVASLSVGLGTVSEVLARARAAGLDFAAADALTDAELEQRLYGDAPYSDGEKPVPDPVALYVELKRPGVTLALLHHEYLERQPGGLKYTQYCEYYRQWKKKQRRTLHHEHRAGEKGFIDYSGKKPSIVDPQSGECREVELFVFVLSGSSLTYAEATATQRTADFLASHVRAFEYFGGVPALLVPDQLRTAVGTPCRYEPAIQRGYEELAEHYDTAILPARPAKPRDKAKVEVAVQVVQRWIVARLRHETHFSLASLNARIEELLVLLNDRPMRRYLRSRRVLFEEIERSSLRPLPATRFVHAEWKVGTVNIDSHVAVDGHFYSAPHELVGESIEIRISANIVEILNRGRRMASHARSLVRGGYTTVTAHLPRAHQSHLEWTPTRLIEWAATIGASTKDLVAAILSERKHPEMGYRSCLGILRLARRYGKERLEAAAVRALHVRARSYRHVDSILKNGLDRLPLRVQAPAVGTMPAQHEHLRGPGYYQGGGEC